VIRIGFFFLLLGLDVVSKLVALGHIPPMNIGGYPYGGIGIFSNFLGISFSLNMIVNTGAAWGMFAGHSGLLFGLRTAVIVGLVSYLLFYRSGSTPKIPLWLVVIGALGNAIDYALYGHVIDFFHFVFWGYSFPIFNLADSYITLGVLGILFLTRRAKKQHAI
jgi:signal peptidase II